MNKYVGHIVYRSIIAVVLVLGPFGIHLAHADGIIAKIFGFSWDGFWAGVGTVFLTIAGSFVAITGPLLNAAIQLTIVDMSEFVNSLTAIELSWRVFRDFANIFFIFVLVYAAIATILRTANFQLKQIVVRLVVVALLVNFSLFFTKIVIDFSNIVALQFYNAITVRNETTGQSAGLADIFMDSLQLTSIYNIKTGDTGAAGSTEILEPNNIFSITLFGSIFFLITAFIFVAGVAFLVIRFTLLILAMVVAPFALVAMILPQSKQYWNKWWNTVLRQAFFAPIYLAILYLTVRIVSDTNFKAFLYGRSGGSSLASELSGNSSGTAGVVLAFGIVSALLISSLIIANKMSVEGAGTVMGWGKKARGWATKNIPGGIARKTLGAFGSSELVNKGVSTARRRLEENRVTRLVGLGALGRASERGLQNLSEKQFFGAKSHKQVTEQKQKRVSAGVADRKDDQAAIARFLRSYSGPMNKKYAAKAYQELSSDQRIKVEKQLRRMGQESKIKYFRDQLSDEERRKTLDSEVREFIKNKQFGGLVTFFNGIDNKKDQESIYKNLSATQRAQFENKLQDKNRARELRNTLSDEEKEKTLSARGKMYLNDLPRLAQLLKSELNKEERNAVYESLSARNRVAVETHLDRNTIEELRSILTPDEKIKTEKAEREARGRANAQGGSQGSNRSSSNQPMGFVMPNNPSSPNAPQASAQNTTPPPAPSPQASTSVDIVQHTPLQEATNVRSSPEAIPRIDIIPSVENESSITTNTTPLSTGRIDIPSAGTNTNNRSGRTAPTRTMGFVQPIPPQNQDTSPGNTPISTTSIPNPSTPQSPTPSSSPINTPSQATPPASAPTVNNNGPLWDAPERSLSENDNIEGDMLMMNNKIGTRIDPRSGTSALKNIPPEVLRELPGSGISTYTRDMIRKIVYDTRRPYPGQEEQRRYMDSDPRWLP